MGGLDENKVKCHHPYDAEQEDELTIGLNDVVEVEERNENGWWLGRNLTSDKRGLFPSNFVMDLSVIIPAAASGGELVKVAYDYEAQAPDELELKKGDIVTVISKDEGWWTGEIKGRVGVFPENFIVPYTEAKKEETDEPVSPSSPSDEKASADKKRTSSDGFKLSAFGVKKGGLGSLFSGGKSLKGKSKSTKEESQDLPPIQTELKISDGPRSPPQPSRDLPPIPPVPSVPRPSVPEDIKELITEEKVAAPEEKESISGDEEIKSVNEEEIFEDKAEVPSETEKEKEVDTLEESDKGKFKLAAYGVKMGGIGGLLASGFPQLKKTSHPHGSPKPSETPAVTNSDTFGGTRPPLKKSVSHSEKPKEDDSPSLKEKIRFSTAEIEKIRDSPPESPQLNQQSSEKNAQNKDDKHFDEESNKSAPLISQSDEKDSSSYMAVNEPLKIQSPPKLSPKETESFPVQDIPEPAATEQAVADDNDPETSDKSPTQAQDSELVKEDKTCSESTHDIPSVKKPEDSPVEQTSLKTRLSQNEQGGSIPLPTEFISGPKGKRPASRKPRAAPGDVKPLTQSEALEKEVQLEKSLQPSKPVSVNAKPPGVPIKPVLARLNSNKESSESIPSETTVRPIGRLSKSPFAEQLERASATPSPPMLGGGSIQERLKVFLREELEKIREEFRLQLEEERTARIKVQDELELLKAQISSPKDT